MLQVVVHSLVASMLFSLLGEGYEVQGSRMAKHLRVQGHSSSILLMVLLANGVLGILLHSYHSSYGPILWLSMLNALL